MKISIDAKAFVERASYDFLFGYWRHLTSKYNFQMIREMEYYYPSILKMRELLEEEMDKRRARTHDS